MSSSDPPLPLPSFPTRRSSDLPARPSCKRGPDTLCLTRAYCGADDILWIESTMPSRRTFCTQLLSALLLADAAGQGAPLTLEQHDTSSNQNDRAATNSRPSWRAIYDHT